MAGIKLIGGNTPIDPEIKPLIVELNKKGIVTTGSCAGHGKYGSGMGPTRRGYIFFSSRVGTSRNADTIVSIMKKHGCKNTRFTSGGSVVTFAPMGKITTKKEKDAQERRWNKMVKEKFG